MLRQAQTKLRNIGYHFVLNTLFHQTSNISFSGNGNLESVNIFVFRKSIPHSNLIRKC